MPDDQPAGDHTTADIPCPRCQQSDGPRLTRAPMPGDLGREIVEKICQRCWDEWQNMEVIVINELRLNFMDPEAQETLVGQMREFLQLDGPGKPGGTT